MPKRIESLISKGAATAAPKPTVERSCANCDYAIPYNQSPWLDCAVDLPPAVSQTGKTKVHQSYKCVFHKLKD